MSEPTPQNPVLTVCIEGPVAVVTINRPEAMNSCRVLFSKSWKRPLRDLVKRFWSRCSPARANAPFAPAST